MQFRLCGAEKRMQEISRIGLHNRSRRLLEMNDGSIMTSGKAVNKLKSSSVDAVLPRNEVLDSIKGLLVLGMVVFHSINYFAYEYRPLLPYIRFVSGGFVIISGY